MNGRESRRIRADITQEEKADVEDLICRIHLLTWNRGRTGNRDTAEYTPLAFARALTRQLVTFEWWELRRGPGRREGALGRLENWCHPIRPNGLTERERYVTPRARWISYLLFGTVVGRDGHEPCNACPEYGTDQLPPRDVDGLRSLYPAAP